MLVVVEVVVISLALTYHRVALYQMIEIRLLCSVGGAPEAYTVVVVVCVCVFRAHFSATAKN